MRESEARGRADPWARQTQELKAEQRVFPANALRFP
jgi:hypothetical protein